MQGRDSSWDVLSYLAPKPIHPPLLPFSVICRRSGNERFRPSEKTSPSTDTFYIWTAAPPSSPLLSNFLSVAVSCDLLSTPIREVRWKTRGGEGTLLLTSSSFLSLSFWNVRRETERVGWDFRCVANCLIQLPLETVMRKGSLLNPKYVKSVFLPLSFMKTTLVCYGPYARHCVPNPFAQRCCSSQFFVWILDSADFCSNARKNTAVFSSTQDRIKVMFIYDVMFGAL